MEAVAEAIRRLVEVAIDVSPTEIVIQLAATAALVVVVKVFLWDKVTAFLDARREAVDHELNEATEKHEDAQSMKKEAEQELEEARQKAKEIVDEAKSRGEDTRREILAEAKQEAERIKKNARQDLDREVEVARRNLQREIVEIAALISEKAAGEQLSDATYERLLDEAIEEVRKH